MTPIERPDEEPKKKGSGCAKAAGIGCLVVLILAGVGTYLVVKNAKRFALVGAAKATEIAGQAVISGLNLPKDEAEAAMVPVRELSAKIKQGEVSLEQAAKMGESLAQGPLMSILVTRAFEVTHLDKARIPEEERARGRVTVARFMSGLAKKQIPVSEGERVSGILMVTTKDTSGNERSVLRDSITVDELRLCLKIMKEASDKARIPRKPPRTNVSDLIREIINAGLDDTATDRSQPLT